MLQTLPQSFRPQSYFTGGSVDTGAILASFAGAIVASAFILGVMRRGKC